MTYLDMALAALTECEKSEKSPLLSAGEAERLKAEIIAAVDVEPSEFDRGAYDALWARWSAHEAAGGDRDHHHDELLALRLPDRYPLTGERES